MTASTIRTAVEEGQDGLYRYYSALVGTVVDVNDPLSRHRVKAEIRGLVEPSTDWLYPLTMGGGGPQKGGHVAPSVGSSVVIFFLGGDMQGVGWYLGGHWGDGEVPAALEGLTPTDAAKVHVLEAGGFTVLIDERGGARQLAILDQTLGSIVQVNGELGEVLVQGAVSVRIQAARVSIEGADVTINGRTVLPSSKPI